MPVQFAKTKNPPKLAHTLECRRGRAKLENSRSVRLTIDSALTMGADSTNLFIKNRLYDARTVALIGIKPSQFTPGLCSPYSVRYKIENEYLKKRLELDHPTIYHVAADSAR